MITDHNYLKSVFSIVIIPSGLSPSYCRAESSIKCFLPFLLVAWIAETLGVSKSGLDSTAGRNQTRSLSKQGNSVARDLPRTGSETNTTIFVINYSTKETHIWLPWHIILILGIATHIIWYQAVPRSIWSTLPEIWSTLSNYACL